MTSLYRMLLHLVLFLSVTPLLAINNTVALNNQSLQFLVPSGGPFEVHVLPNNNTYLLIEL